MRTERCACAQLLAALLLSLLASLVAAADDSELLARYPKSHLVIATQDARQHRFDVWLADTPARRAQGLMWVSDLPDATGMLFVYPRPQPISMWMKATRIALDMLFVRSDGRIVRVVENTKPYSLESITSGEDVLGVIELEAGVARRLGIRRGSIVEHPAFGTARER